MPHSVAKSVIATRRDGFRSTVVVRVGSGCDIFAITVPFLIPGALFRNGTSLTIRRAVRVAAIAVSAKVREAFGAHGARQTNRFLADPRSIARLTLRLTRIVLHARGYVDACSRAIANLAFTSATGFTTHAIHALPAYAFDRCATLRPKDFLVDTRTRCAITIGCHVAMKLTGAGRQAGVARTYIRNARFRAAIIASSRSIADIGVELREPVGATIRGNTGRARGILLTRPIRTDARVSARRYGLRLAFRIRIRPIGDIATIAVYPAAFLRRRTSLTGAITCGIAADIIHAKSADTLRPVSVRTGHTIEFLTRSASITSRRAGASGTRIRIAAIGREIPTRSLVARYIARFAIST